jgi:hypothetical protein
MAQNETHYGCAGSCGGEVTEAQYKAGMTKCGDKSCERYGKPLEKLQFCSSCNEYYPNESAADHANCS